MNEMTAGEAAERLQKIYNESLTSDWKPNVYDQNALRYAASILRRVESGELAEVVHAHWIKKTTPWNMGCEKYLACSNCDARQCDTYEENGNQHCDECGALMDESDMRQTRDGKDDSHETD